MLITSEEACGKECCFRNSETKLACKGSQCMAWRWSEEEMTHWSMAVRDAGEMLLNDSFSQECALDAAKDMQGPPGKGWKMKGVYLDIDDEETLWRAIYERKADPERKGFCGYAGEPRS